MDRNSQEHKYKFFDSKIHAFGNRLKKISFPGFEGVPVYNVFWFFVEGLKKGSLNLRATAIAFNFILALGPALVFFLTLLPYLPIRNFQDSLKTILFEIIPSNSFIAIEPLLNEVFTHKAGLPIIGLLTSLFFAQKGIHGILEGFNATSHYIETRKWYKQRLVSIGLLFIFYAVIVVVMSLFFFSKFLVTSLADISSVDINTFLFISGKWIILLTITFLSISFLYYMAPNKRLKWKFFSAGSTVATILTILASLGFTYFMDNFAQLNKFFGSIGAIVALMLWMNFNAISLLIGFELNASINNAHLDSKSIEK